MRRQPHFSADYEELRGAFPRGTPANTRKMMQRMCRKELVIRIYPGVFELSDKPLIPLVREAERHIASTVDDIVRGPPHVNGLQLTTRLGRRGSKAFHRILAALLRAERRRRRRQC